MVGLRSSGTSSIVRYSAIRSPPSPLTRGYRRAQTVEAQRILAQHLPLQRVRHVGAVADRRHAVRPGHVPVRIIRGVEDLALADPLGRQWDQRLLRLAADV